MSESISPVDLEPSYPDAALVYDPVPHLQSVEIPVDDDRVHITLTGTAYSGSGKAVGSDAGTYPENEHGAGTEQFTVVVRNIGPPMDEVGQVAAFMAGDMGMIRVPSRWATVGGQSVTGTRAALVNGRLGVSIDLELVGFESVDAIQFQITCTGRKAPESPGRDGRPDEEMTASSTRFDTPPTRHESSPFERERNDAFSNNDFA